MTFFDLINKALQLDGDFAEFGVYRGDSAFNIGLQLKKVDKVFYLFDSFVGHPEPSKEDNYHPKIGYIHYKGRYADTSPQAVINQMNPTECKYVIISGFFDNTVHFAKNLRLAFVHLDCDLYNSYTTVLDNIYDSIVKGGIILIDDYLDKNCNGCVQAVNEFLAKHKLSIQSHEPKTWIMKP